MTKAVLKTLNEISNIDALKSHLYFIGGTALSYYLEHRVSEDIDLISDRYLEHRKIIPQMIGKKAIKVPDENATALRMAGLFPDDHIIKFKLNDVKVEFFNASTNYQKEVISKATISKYNGYLNILDLKSIAKLKFFALIKRNKSRDLFDCMVIIEKGVLDKSDMKEFSNHKDIDKSLDDIYQFIEDKKEPKDDEMVYLDEDTKIDISFDEIKKNFLSVYKKYILS